MARLPAQTAADRSPAQIADAAERAVHDDSADVVWARWTAALHDDPADREAMLGLATLARATFRFETADTLYRALLARSRGTVDAWSVQARLGLSWVAGGLGDSRTGDSLLSIAIAEARQVGDRPAEIGALIGFTTIRASDTHALYATMDSIARLLPFGDGRDRAEYLCRLGLFRGVGGDSKAIDTLRRGMAMAGRVGERRLVGHCLEAYGLMHSILGQNDSALAIYDRAGVLLEATHEHAGLSRNESRRSDILQAYGRLGEARLALERVVAEAAISRNRQRMANALGGMGMLALRVGDLPTATEHFEHAAALNDSLGQVEGGMIARQNRGEVLAASGDLAAAREAFEGTLAEAERGEFLEDVVIARQRLARIAIRQGEWAEAERQIAAADSAATSHGLEEIRSSLLYDRGRLALGRRDLPAAERLFSAFLAQTAPDDRLIRYTARSRLAQVWAARGNLDRAQRELTEANAELERWRASVGFDELRRYAFAATVAGEYDSQSPAASVLAALASGGRAEAAMTLAEQRRARTLADRLTQADALREAAASGMPHRDRPATAAEIVAAMPDDSTALLEYVAGSDGAPTTLFIVTRGGISAHVLPTADSLKEPIARLVALLESSQSADALAGSLGRIVLGPATALAGGISRLIVVPDGPLHRLPFDALRLPDGRLAVERWAIGLAPSAAVATVLRRKHSPPTGGESLRVLALGDPAFAGERSSGLLREAETFRGAFEAAGGLPRLSASGDEVRDVARYSPASAVVRLRGEASESWLKQASLAPFGVIHLATHALVDESSLARTSLALAPGGGEDGFLTPADLAALKLEADLVVLSACRTAGGVMVAGEGMQGLTSPLIEAGARAVVATQWRISDRGTVRLVDDFYAGLGRGLPVVAALRQAKLAAIRRGAPAGEWAAFTVVGDPLVRVPLREPAPRARLWWWSMGGVIVVIAALAARKRRGRRLSAADLRGRRYLVTGANSGIGRAVADALAARGGNVVLGSRSEERARPVLDTIRSRYPAVDAQLLPIDLSDLGSVRRAAEQFLATGHPLDALINNAGIAGTHGLSRDGFDLTYATNHIGPFLLTNVLLPAIRAAAQGRIVNVASVAHMQVKRIDWSVLERRSAPKRSGFADYAVTKLMNVLHAKELARRLAGTGVTTYALHPGGVATNVWRSVPQPLRWILMLFLVSEEEGAKTPLYCATAPELATVTGRYYVKCREARCNPLADDEALAKELWERTESAIGR